MPIPAPAACLASTVAVSALALLLSLSCSSPDGGLPVRSTPPPPGHVPGATWERVGDIGRAGWDRDALAEAHRLWEGNSGTSTVLIVQNGLVVAQWGDPTEKRDVRSIRKSLLSGLLAEPITSGTLRLDSTLAELGIDDATPLTEAEKRATLADLLASRSGVYIPAARETSGHRRRRPQRGSHPPGTHFYYNNWDFNVLGVIYRDRVAADVGGELAERIAGPIGMEDFQASDFEWRQERISPHPAYAIDLSARDLARYGLLWARRGRWGDRQVIPAAWVDRSTRAVTDETFAGSGYGWQWWVQPPGRSSVVPEGYFYAEGGSYLWVVPSRDLVIVHHNRSGLALMRSKLGLLPDEERIWEIFTAVIAAAPTGEGSPAR